MYVNNKYKRWYDELIESRKYINRSKTDGYYETHHITPKSFGGDNSDYNLVLLTAREHYIAHFLLTKFTTGEFKKKMMFALCRFSNISNNSRLYEKFKKSLAKEMMGENNPSFGKRWIKHREKNIILFVDGESVEKYIKDGYEIGLLNQLGGSNMGKIFINNGVEEKMIPNSHNIPNGWKRGRIHKLSEDDKKRLYDNRIKNNSYLKRSEKIRNRVKVYNSETNTSKMISINDLNYYEKMGYVRGSSPNKNIKPCSIDGIEYISGYDVALSKQIPIYTVYYRLKSDNEKWKGWFYL